MMKAWVAKLVYRSEEFGTLDVEFAVDDMDELAVLVMNGPGVGCLVSMTMERPVDLPVNETIESLVRKLAAREDEGC
jgi:hypothetical protein